MGLIKKLLGGLFSFLGGLGKLLGLGKSSEYFLEAEPANDAAPAALTAPAAAAAAPAKAAAAKTAAAPAETAVAASPALDAATPAAEVKTNGKTPALAAAAPAPAPKAAPEPAPAAEQTFAPNFVLLNSGRGGRRRPGPSLNPFLDMARQVRPQG
ncbi:MAG: hypothetical protein Fur0046_03220 [Cyanobacteria bacterium J069]|nr:MAG: hypothetical protein D6742_04370 [Cyanobacteria bacterium J069]